MSCTLAALPLVCEGALLPFFDAPPLLPPMRVTCSCAIIGETRADSFVVEAANDGVTLRLRAGGFMCDAAASAAADADFDAATAAALMLCCCNR